MGSHSKLQKPCSEDRISSLPDSILCHILSLLPTKFVVATSILSTRWKYLWASIPNLDFDDSVFFKPEIDCLNPREKLSFMNFVDTVMTYRDSSINLDKFSLICRGNCNLNRVKEWVCAAIRENVKEIELGVYLRDPFDLPTSLFRCKSLVVLSVKWKIVIDVPSGVCFSSLKALHFYGVKFLCYESMEKILGGCPVLQDLAIRRCRWVQGRVLNICGSTLKGLTLDCNAVVMGDPEPEIVVDAPILEYLDIKDYISENFLRKDLCSLVKANVDVAQKYEQLVPMGVYANRVFELLKGISTVKFLSLSRDTIEAISYVYDYNFPTFDNLTTLELGVAAWSGWAMLPSLLASSPILENLVFMEGIIHNSHFQVGFFHFCWSPPQHVPACLLSHLKEIEIKNFRGLAEELILVKYLLKNAKVLNKMSIDCSFVKEDLKIHRKLLKFRRGSTTCHLDIII